LGETKNPKLQLRELLVNNKLIGFNMLKKIKSSNTNKTEINNPNKNTIM